MLQCTSVRQHDCCEAHQNGPRPLTTEYLLVFLSGTHACTPETATANSLIIDTSFKNVFAVAN
jgi:hypothetical protein